METSFKILTLLFTFFFNLQSLTNINGFTSLPPTTAEENRKISNMSSAIDDHDSNSVRWQLMVRAMILNKHRVDQKNELK